VYQNPSCELDTPSTVKKLPIVTGSGSPLLSSQDLGTESYPDPDEFNPRPDTLLFLDPF
jgi:hypothetical protein